jgi:membrane associated rhomboid family serine protease
MGGGILSNILYPLFRLKAGSSNSLYGMIGLVFGYIIINWSGMAIIGCIFKFKLILLFFLISGYLLLFTDVAPEIDYYGHLGGFAGGLFLSGINPTLQKTKR